MLGNLFTQKKQITLDSDPIAPNPVGSDSAAISSSHSDIIGSSINPTLRQDISVISHLDARALAVVERSKEEALRLKKEFIEPDDLLFGLLYDSEIFAIFEKASLNPSQISKEVQNRAKPGNFFGEPKFSDKSKKVLEDAFQNAKDQGSDFISPENLLFVLSKKDFSSGELLASLGLKEEDLAEKLGKDIDTSSKKSFLARYGVDLTEQARSNLLDPVFGRDIEIDRIVHILLRRTKNNPVVIGEAGVGKTAIIEGLAQKIVAKSAASDLLEKRIIQLDVSSLVAGASHRGEFEERLRNVIRETQAQQGKVILFIDEVHNLIGAGDNEGVMDASNIIKPFLARGQLQIIGTSTTAEYRRHFEKDKAFERRFQPVLLEEPSEEVAVGMLEILKQKYETFHKVTITKEAIEASVHLSKRYIGQRFLPDKAVDLLDEAAAEVRLKKSEGKRQDSEVKKEDIERVVSAWTGIPITKLTENESEKLLHLESFIHKRLINQENAVSAVSEAVRRGRIGLTSASRPIASFIFLGPTGVGKTEAAKALAEILFGKEESMVRLDMSEYMEKHEVAKLIGAPPGYVGYEEGGQLTEAVRTKPYSIVLLDEIEKAHPDVFNILLQLLEDGRLTDNKGNTISFKNTIIIATSNIGSVLIQQQLSDVTANQDAEKRFKEVSGILLQELRKFFKPELLNRFDEVVIFEPLTEANMTDIAKLGINATRKLLTEQKINLEITDKAIARLAKEGYDPVFGARPLRRLIQTSIENPIALLIIGKTFVENDTILVDYDEQKSEFTFNKSQKTEAKNPSPAEFGSSGTNGHRVQEVKNISSPI